MKSLELAAAAAHLVLSSDLPPRSAQGPLTLLPAPPRLEMAASSTATKQEIEEAKVGGLKADHPKPPRGRSDTEVVPYDSPFYSVAMTGKELSEGGEA
eukprot:415628-Alexandrium_andersonii.AAC.1